MMQNTEAVHSVSDVVVRDGIRPIATQHHAREKGGVKKRISKKKRKTEKLRKNEKKKKKRKKNDGVISLH